MIGKKYRQWRNERKRNSCPESRGVGNAIVVMLGTFVVGSAVVIKGILGGSDRQNAQDLLANQNYKIETYNGKANILSRGLLNYYSDEFNVVSPSGAKQRVLVTRMPLSDRQEISFLINK